MAEAVPAVLQETDLTDGLTAFPKDDIDPELKESEEWNLLVAEALYGNRKSFGSTLFYNNQSENSENLKWALGRNDSSEYEYLLGQNKIWSKGITREIRNYITKRINIVIKKILSNQYDIEVENINPTAIDAKEDYRARMQLYLDNKKSFDDISNSAGIPVEDMLHPGQTSSSDVPKMENLPQSQDDLDMFFDNDYKTIAEIGIELGVKHHLRRNKYEQNIRPLGIFSEFVFGVRCVYDGFDDNMMPIVEHVDIQDLIIPYQKNPDYSNLPYVGQLIWMSASDFRKSACGFLKEDEIQEVIRTYSRIQTDNMSHFVGEQLIRNSDVHRICIVRYNYRSTDMVARVKKEDGAGNPVLYKKEWDYYAPKDSLKQDFDEEGGRKKLYRKPVNTVYEGYWVVGSKTIYRQGRRASSVRKRGNLSEDLMGYKISATNAWAGEVTPTMRLVIPVLRDLQTYTVKMQQAVKASIPKGGFIDLDALRSANIKWDNKDLTDQEKVEMFMMTGWGLTSSKGRHQPGSNYKPFIEAENGMARDVLTYGTLIMNALNELDGHIGLNAASSAATVSPELGKAVYEGQINSTDVALGWITDSDKRQFTELCESLCILHIKSVKYGPREYYNRVFGRLTTGLLYSDIPFDRADFGFYINNQTTQLEWKELYDQATLAHKDGHGWLTFSQYMRLREFDSIKQARKYLATCEKNAMKAAQDKSQNDMAANAQLQQDSAKAKTEGDIAVKNAEADGKIKVLVAERENLKLKYDLETQMRIAVQQDQRGLSPVISQTPKKGNDVVSSPAPELEKADENAQLMDDLKS